MTGNGTAFTWVSELVASLNIGGLSLPMESVESDGSLTLVKPSPVSVVDSDYLLEFSSSASALAASNNEGVLNILNRLSLKGEILDGDGTPSIGQGDNGDAYIDTQNADLYLKKAGVWGSPAANLKGDTGDSLELDAVGLAVARSTHDDAAALFTFMAEDTGQIAIKRSATSGDWSAWIDFQGPQGIQGDAGLDGADGAPGADGASWSAGTLPDDLIGSDGDFHLEADGDVFAKVSGAWAATAINLTGPQGLQGNPGQDGSDGLIGPTGPQGRSFDPDAQEPAINRSNYDAEADGFAFLATDTNQVSWKQSATSGDWSAWVDWGGAGGASGAGSTTPLGMFVAASL